MLQDEFVIAAETTVGQSRQIRLENLIKVFLGTRCFPMRRHFAFNLLAALSEKHLFLLSVKTFSMRMVGDLSAALKGNFSVQLLFCSLQKRNYKFT